MFADAKINTYGWNTSGWHVFGNADMRDSWAPIDRYNFSGIWPSSKGVSVKNVSDIIINSNLPPPPVPLFTANVTSGVAPLVVKFTDQSTGIIISWAWDFNGDGIIDSTLQNPEITFLDPGTYPVNLTVTNAGGSKSLEKFSYIAVSSVPVDDWSITLNGAGSEVLTRTNFETLAEGNRLTYNDGSSTWSGVALWRILARVDDSNPATFNDAVADLGYTVNVSASDGFSAKFTSATLKRNDNWIVADTVNGTALPKLDGKGKMFWPLKLVGSETTSGSQRIANITSITLENLPSAPTAAFTSDVQSGNAPLTVKFTDQSTGTGPLTYTWDFNNDGSVDNTTQSPSYTYTNPGTYSVNLTVTNGIGSDTELKTSYITVTAVPVVNDWSITLNGAGSEVLTRTNFETLAEGNRLTYNDGSSTLVGGSTLENSRTCR